LLAGLKSCRCRVWLVGRGIANARQGARRGLIITEIDPTKGIESGEWTGFRRDAELAERPRRKGDVFITVRD